MGILLYSVVFQPSTLCTLKCSERFDFYFRVHFFIDSFQDVRFNHATFWLKKYSFDSAFQAWGFISPYRNFASPMFRGLQKAHVHDKTTPASIVTAVWADWKTKSSMGFWQDPPLFSLFPPFTTDSSQVSHSHCLGNSEQIWGDRESR